MGRGRDPQPRQGHQDDAAPRGSTASRNAVGGYVRGRARPGDGRRRARPSSCSRSSASRTRAALALIISLLDLVPLVGATLGAIIVGIVTLFNDFPTDTIVWVVWSIVYQQVENTSSSRASRPATVNVAAVRGAGRGAVRLARCSASSGALLAIPVAARSRSRVREYRDYRRLSDEPRRRRPRPAAARPDRRPCRREPA